MKNRIYLLTGIIILFTLTTVFIAIATTTPLPGIKRTDLQRHDLSVQGREVVQALVELGPGVLAPRHSHPGEEIIYVVKGVFEYVVDNKAPVTVKAGEVLFIPAGAIHSARNVGSGSAAELPTYIVEKGKPLLVAAN